MLSRDDIELGAALVALRLVLEGRRRAHADTVDKQQSTSDDSEERRGTRYAPTGQAELAREADRQAAAQYGRRLDVAERGRLASIEGDVEAMNESRRRWVLRQCRVVACMVGWFGWESGVGWLAVEFVVQYGCCPKHYTGSGTPTRLTHSLTHSLPRTVSYESCLSLYVPATCYV